MQMTSYLSDRSRSLNGCPLLQALHAIEVKRKLSDPKKSRKSPEPAAKEVPARKASFTDQEKE